MDLQRNKKYIWIGMVVLTVILLAVSIIISWSKQSTQPINTENNLSNTSTYEFLSSDKSDQEKYLMLQAKILIESYGTYSQQDLRSLENVLNQSTVKFKQVVQQKIDSVDGQNLVTLVDPDSINIDSLSSQETRITATASVKDTNGLVQTSQARIDFVLQDNYWLVSNLTLTPNEK